MLLIVKILFAILLIVGISLFFGKFRKKPASFVVGLCVLTLIASLISFKITNLIPRPTDNITITATGEKNENALSSEVSIKCLKLEGEEIVLDNAVEGKWFWKGDCYMWRPETDDRQPEGVTRSITLSIPVGLDRALVFDNNAYRGIVEITFNGTTTEYDLYSENSKDFKVKIPTSDSALVYGYKALSFLLFAAVICVLMAFPCFAVLRKPENIIRAWFANNWDRLYYITLAVLYVIVLQSVSAKGSLWGDEVWPIGWMYEGYPYRTDLHFFLIKLWLYLVPYGQENLMLLSQICVAIAIFVAGEIGRLVKGKRMGVLLSTLVASSLTVMYQCAMEYRQYPFLFLFSSLMVYFYIRKHKTFVNERTLDIVLYSVFAICSMDVHQFGFAAGCMLLFSDLILLLLGKGSKKSWFQFVLPGIYAVFWSCTTFFDRLDEVVNYPWAGAPTPEKLLNTLKWLSGSNDFLFAMLIFGAVLISVQTIIAVKNKKFSFCKDYDNIVFLLIPIALLSIDYIYSTVINPENSLFIDRYFISVIIYLLYIIAFSLDYCIDLISSALSKQYIMQTLTTFAGVILLMTSWSRVSEWNPYPANDRTRNQDYAGVAEYIRSCNDIYSPSVIFVLDHNFYADSGMNYYLTQKGKRDKINHCALTDLPDNIAEYDVIYMSYIKWGISGKIKPILDENYTEVSDDTEHKVKKFVRNS